MNPETAVQLAILIPLIGSVLISAASMIVLFFFADDVAQLLAPLAKP